MTQFTVAATDDGFLISHGEGRDYRTVVSIWCCEDGSIDQGVIRNNNNTQLGAAELTALAEWLLARAKEGE
jgi:hypothetical protein